MSAAHAFLGASLKLVDFILWILLLGPAKLALKLLNNQPCSLFVHREEDGEKVYRRIGSPKNLSDFECPDGKNTYRILLTAAGRFGSQPALGTRQFLGFLQGDQLDGEQFDGFKNLAHHEDYQKCRFPTRVFGPTSWETYDDVIETVNNIGSALGASGLRPQPKTAGWKDYELSSADHSILIYEDSCKEWILMALGAHSQGISVATTYATLGIDSVASAAEELGVKTIFCNYKSVETLLKSVSSFPNLKTIIYGKNFCTEKDIKPLSHPYVEVISFEDFVVRGKKNKIEPSEPSPNNVAVVMYTSGSSSGKPKGVILSHNEISSALAALKPQCSIKENESLVGYLPLAHIFELQMELAILSSGGRIGYADPKSLSGGPGKCVQKIGENYVPVGALAEFRPTVFGGVPKVWETIKNGIEAKVKGQGGVKQFLFETAVKWKIAATRQGRTSPLFDKIVFAKVKENVGGRLRAALSGGGAISASVQDWNRAVFGCSLSQGYGLTETCAGLTTQSIDDVRSGFVGDLLPTLELRLHSLPDVLDKNGQGYLSTDTHHLGEPCLGRGEIFVRGPSISHGGYLKNDAENAEAYVGGRSDNSWFKTGDVGVLFPDGSLKIVDRRKNLVKLKGGEYVALEKMNQVYSTNEYVNTDGGGVCCYASDELDRPVAFIQVHEHKSKELLNQYGSEEAVKKVILQSLLKTGKTSDPALLSLEMLKDIAILDKKETEWNPHDGTLTASLKISPKIIAKKYSAELALMIAAQQK